MSCSSERELSTQVYQNTSHRHEIGPSSHNVSQQDISLITEEYGITLAIPQPEDETLQYDSMRDDPVIAAQLALVELMLYYHDLNKMMDQIFPPLITMFGTVRNSMILLALIERDMSPQSLSMVILAGRFQGPCCQEPL